MIRCRWEGGLFVLPGPIRPNEPSHGRSVEMFDILQYLLCCTVLTVLHCR
jgi:hypothetical protein